MTAEEFKNYVERNRQIIKMAFLSADDLNKQAGAAPMDPNAAAAMPPPPPPQAGAPMDPAAMAGGMPAGDPAMMGMAPQGEPVPEGPSPDEIVDMLETMSNGMQQFEGDVNALKQEVQELRVQIAEAMGTMKTIMDILNKGSASAPKATVAPTI